MVCPRCIEAVKQTLQEHQIGYDAVILGRVDLKKSLKEGQKKKLTESLSSKGFELLEDTKAKLIEQIKLLVIKNVHQRSKSNEQASLADILSKEIPYEYSYLSKLFSSVEGITLEKFVIKHKIELAKEWLIYEQLPLEVMAERLGFNSGSYLSALFKKETGMSPSAFKKLQNPNALKRSLDNIPNKKKL